MATGTKADNSTSLPMRGSTHRIDTRAVRLVIGQLHEDWLVRSLEERDYGIDLQLEIFSDDTPTGNLVFIQVKGTEKSFEEEPDFNCEVKTILYAELFQAPFFLFRTSLADKKTKFVWLQKFSETALPLSSPNWRNQGHVTIKIPEDNDLVSNVEKFTKIVNEQNRHRQALSFLKIETNLKLHAPSVLGNQFGIAAFCADEARKLTALEDFVVGKDFQGEQDFEDVKALMQIFEDISMYQKIDEKQKNEIIRILDVLENIKIIYLGEDEMDSFMVAHGHVLY